MAKSNDTAPRAGEAKDQAGAACRAEDLRDLLQHIAERLADTDRRHTDALEQMQARLAALGEEARRIRPSVPREFMPAFDRVEEGLDMLAERIHETAAQHSAHRRNADAVTADMMAADMAHAASWQPVETGDAQAAHAAAQAAAQAAAHAAAMAAQEAEQLIASAAAVVAPAGQQMPLRSAVPGAPGGAAAHAGAFDPFDVVDRTHPETSDAWDTASAEALSRIYETSEAGFMRRMPDPDAAPAAAASAASAAASGGAPGLAVEREWLETRFADIARRVEQSLAEARPESSLRALGNRFEQFEQRLGSALGDVATRADVEGLRLVEAHINELAAHLEHAQAQLARLDGIESQLHAVASRLSDRRFVALMENAGTPPAGLETIVAEAAERAMKRFAGTQPPAANLDKLAAAAAEQAVSRLSSTLQQAAPQPLGAAAPAADDARVGEMRKMIESFINERRQGEEHTATMLDTMQQAMIRVLDRIDAMELAQHQAQAQPPVGPQEYVREQVRFNVPPSESVHARSAVEDARSAAEAAVSAAKQAPRQPPSDHGPPSGPVRMIEGEGDQGRIEPTFRPTRVLDEQTKDDFVAAARRARRQVQSQRPAAPDQAGSAATPAMPAPAAPDKAQRAAVGTPLGKTPKGAAAEKLQAEKSETAQKLKNAGASFFGLPRKAVLGGAVAIIAALVAAAVLPKRHNGTAVTAAAPVEATTSAPAASIGATKGAEPAVDLPPAATAPRDAAPPQQDAASVPRPAMDFERQQFNGQKTEERSPDAEKMSASPEGESNAAIATQAALAGAPAPDATEPALGGITLQHGSRLPTPQDLARLDQQQRMANLSSELGAAAVSPAALVVEQQMSATQSAQGQGAAPAPASAASGGRSALDLPPATVGPLSLRLAAARGDASAEFEVGARLAEGKGTGQNFAEAVKWYQRSAQKGFAQAQYRLGTLYERGLGTKTDLARARVWYKRAAEQGNVKSMHNLAVLSAGREAGSPDYATAAQWFGEAADRGLADSQFNLAVLYESGLGVGKDIVQAYKWMTLAARSGDRETVKRREALRAKLTAGELEKAQKLLHDWQSKPTELLANDARAAGQAWQQQSANGDAATSE